MMVWHPFIALVITLRLTLGLFAQPQPPMLTVSLRDVAGSGMAGVIVLVRDASGEREYARGLTNADGLALFDTVPTPDVRVVVVGTLANGTPLLFRGDDALGIRYTLTSEQAVMLLRADLDGSVIPDPEHSVALEHGGSADDLPPEAVVAPSLPTAAPTIATPGELPSSSAAERSAPPAADATPVWLVAVVVLVVVVVGGGAAVLVLMRERL